MSGKNAIKTGLLLLVMAALFMLVGWLIGGTSGMILALIVAAGTNVFAWWNSGKMVRRMQGAHELSREQSPQLFEMTEVLAQRAEIPMPKLYIMESDQPNAFATGRNPENAAVCLTTGIVRALTPNELAGVIAHEMAHIRNYDTLTMTFTATMAGAISMLSQYVFWLGGGRSDGPLGALGSYRHRDCCADGSAGGADVCEPHARIRGGSNWCSNLGSAYGARIGFAENR